MSLKRTNKCFSISTHHRALEKAKRHKKRQENSRLLKRVLDHFFLQENRRKLEESTHKGILAEIDERNNAIQDAIHNPNEEKVLKMQKFAIILGMNLRWGMGKTVREKEFAGDSDTILSGEMTHEQAEATCLLHACVHADLKSSHIRDISDLEKKRLLDKGFVAKNARMMPPNSKLAWRCHWTGCSDGSYQTKRASSEEEYEYLKTLYLNGETILSHETNLETLETRRFEMLKRANASNL